MTVLRKLLCISVFEQLNADNPLSTQEKYARTDCMIIYKESTHPNPTSLLESNKLLVGIINNSGKMFLCVHPLKGDKSVIELDTVDFKDSIGKWCYDLWYYSVFIKIQREHAKTGKHC